MIGLSKREGMERKEGEKKSEHNKRKIRVLGGSPVEGHKREGGGRAKEVV